MKVEIIKCLEDNFSYILINEANRNCCVVDPGEADPIINYLQKNKLNLKYILNTHHHHDHVGGNEELKKKFNAEVVGYIGDKNRIPQIDICLSDGEIWKKDIFEAKIYHVPGHTIGHICFHFYKNKLIFTGDTLFSLGCGRIFEGSYEQMYNSLQVLKNLDKDTKIYCGHEYTLKNSEFCLAQDSNNNELLNKIKEIKEKIKQGKTSMPSTIGEELNCNIFLKSNDLENFKKLRDLKDNF